MDLEYLTSPKSAPWSKQNQVILYGAGGFGGEVQASLEKRGVEVAAFIDRRFKTPDKCRGIPAFSLESEEAQDLARLEVPIIISIFTHLVDLGQVLRDLTNAGFKSIYTAMDIYEWLEGDIKCSYWLASPDFYKKNWDAVIRGLDLWEDEPSRVLYQKLITFRCGKDLLTNTIPLSQPEYAPPDLKRWNNPLRMIDAGANVGQSVEALLSAGYSIEELISFEPDLKNFQTLLQTLRRVVPEVKASLYPCGIGETTGVMKFNSGLGGASFFDPIGTDQALTIAADDVALNQPINLVKMDIEGFETAALLGMKNLIKKQRPGLAICVYHKPEDMWTIPNLIRSWDLGYRFYLRTHNPSTFDTVLYGYPE